VSSERVLSSFLVTLRRSRHQSTTFPDARTSPEELINKTRGWVRAAWLP